MNSKLLLKWSAQPDFQFTKFLLSHILFANPKRQIIMNGRASTLSRRRIPGVTSTGQQVCPKMISKQIDPQTTITTATTNPVSILKLNDKYVCKRFVDDRRLRCQVKELGENYVTVRLFANTPMEDLTIYFDSLQKIWSATGEVLVWTNSNKRKSTLKKMKKREGWVQ